MSNSRGRKRRSTKSSSVQRKIVAVICSLVGLLAAGFSFVVQEYGGRGFVPTWSQLYSWLDVSDEAPDSQVIASGETSVTFLDVGQGDSVLLRQEDHFCLIDAGTPDAADGLISDLYSCGVEELDYVVMTHPHADHIGGMPDVLETFPTGMLILPDLTEYDEESASLERTLDAAAENGIPMYVALDGDTFSLGSGTLTVLQAGETTNDSQQEIDTNNLSLCLRYTAGDFAFVDTGDAEQDVEQQLVNRYGDGLKANLLKAAHHGSSTSNTEAFLNAISPDIVVASCGLNNDYGHPHAEVVDRIQAAGADFYRTDYDGTVTVVYDSGGIQVHCTAADDERQAPAA